MLKVKNQPKATSKKQNLKKQPVSQTFSDHIQELRGRLFWIAVAFVVFTACAYPLFDIIVRIIVLPLGDQELYYLTPIGGFSFIIKVCMFVGAVLTLPIFIYHLYRYIMPLVGATIGKVVLYTFMSFVLAMVGIAFAYFVSLPAALYFLTNFNIDQVSALLTVDSYFSFVVTYLFAAALLFQVPLIMSIVNSVTPMPPRQLMGAQRYVVVAAFVIAALISPTPDVMNQALLAVPIIVMYQIGIVLTMIQNRSRRKPVVTFEIIRPPTIATTLSLFPETDSDKRLALRPAAPSTVPHKKTLATMVAASQQPSAVRTARSLDGISAHDPKRIIRPSRVIIPDRAPRTRIYTRTIDGITLATRQG